MEFKQFIFIIWKRKNILFFTLFSALFLSLFWCFVQPEKHEVVFSIDISRDNFQKTEDYRYDQFYRLQADEKFSETVIQWINHPEFQREIRENYKGNVFSMENLNPEKLSTSFIKISFKTGNDKEYKALVDSIEKTLVEKNLEINNKSGDPSWFSFIVGEPLITKYQVNFKVIVLGALLLGFVLGVFLSLFHYYWQLDENRN